MVEIYLIERIFQMKIKKKIVERIFSILAVSVVKKIAYYPKDCTVGVEEEDFGQMFFFKCAVFFKVEIKLKIILEFQPM
jgi:hypothetical protein